MTDENEIEERTPAVGEAVLVQSEDDGTFEEYHVTEVFDFDDDKGLYKVSCDNGEEYHVYWSEDEKSWVHSDD